MCVQVFMSLGYSSRSGIAVCFGNSMMNFLKNCQVVFQSYCTSLHSHQQSTGLNWWTFSHFPTRVMSCLLEDSHRSECEVVFHSAFNLYFPNDDCVDEYPTFAHFLNWVVFLLLRLKVFLIYIPHTSFLWDIWYINKYFLSFCRLSFQFLVVSLETQSFRLWWGLICGFFFFLLLLRLLVSYLRTNCQIQCHKSLPLCFLLKV